MNDVREDRAHHFVSVDEFMDAAYDAKSLRCPQNERYWAEKKGYIENPDWYGLEPRRDGQPLSYKDIRRIVNDGWTEGLALVTERMDEIEVPYVPSIRRRLTWTDHGDHLEMTRVYSGQLDTAWQRGMRRTCQSPRTIRIAVDNCFPAINQPEDVAWRGVAAITAAYCLTEAGHSVELVSTFKVRSCDDTKYMASIVTKPAMMPLDVANIAATTAFAGFFRHAGICWLYARYENADNGGGGYAEQVKLDDIPLYGVTDRFLVPQGTDSQEKAQAWVNETIIAFGEGASE